MQARHTDKVLFRLVVLYFKTFRHVGIHGTESGREGSIKTCSCTGEVGVGNFSMLEGIWLISR
jgi:hypothetical protein